MPSSSLRNPRQQKQEKIQQSTATMASEYALIQRKLHQLEAQIDNFLPIHQEHPSFDIDHHVIVYRIKHQIDFIKNLITREIDSHQNPYHDDGLQEMENVLSLLENKFKECLVDEGADQEQEEREDQEEGGGGSCLCDLSCIDDQQFETEKETKQEQQDHEDVADSILVDNDQEEVEGDLGRMKEMELREVVLTKERIERIVAETMRRKERKRGGGGWFMGVGVVAAMAGLAGLAIANYLGLENESVYLVPT